MRETNGKQCKVVKNTNFTIMSNIHLQKADMSLKAKGLLSLCLSLPETWDYSIAGLVKLSSDGRDSVTSALNELKKNYFLNIEKKRGKNGLFTSFYTFYENPKENPDYKFNRDGFSDTVEPMRINRCSLTDAEKPQQLITNNKDENKELKQLTLVKTDKAVFAPDDLMNLYKKICIHYPQPVKWTDTRKKKAIKRLQENPGEEFWRTVFEKAEKSLFIRTSKTKWFRFDWVIDNDTNAVKVFEGNYNNKEIENAENEASGSKYSRCYGN